MPALQQEVSPTPRWFIRYNAGILKGFLSKMTKKWCSRFHARGSRIKKKMKLWEKNVWRDFRVGSLSVAVVIKGWKGIFTFTGLLGMGLSGIVNPILYFRWHPMVLECNSFGLTAHFTLLINDITLFVNFSCIYLSLFTSLQAFSWWAADLRHVKIFNIWILFN